MEDSSFKRDRSSSSVVQKQRNIIKILLVLVSSQ